MMNRQKCWETVSQAIPLHTLSESIDVPYDIVLGVNLYNELEKLNFAPKCVEYLKKRSKSKDKLQNDLLFYDIFCGPNMSDYLTVSVFEVKLESLNVWVRYDFESYIMVAAIVSIDFCMISFRII